LNIKILLLFVCLSPGCIFNPAFAQAIKKDKGTINGTAFNFYYMLPKDKVAGIVVLLPGAGEKVKSIFNKTALPALLAEKGFVTIIPEIHTLLYADKHTIDELDEILKTQLDKYHVEHFVIGGFSAGGAIAARYAEYLVENDRSSNLKGLIVVDGPLDLERIHASSERMIIKCDGLIKKQGYSIKSQLEQAFGGLPNLKIETYIKNSSFTASAADGGNAKYLKKLPVRLYSEPDLKFVQDTYCQAFQLEDINATDMEKLHYFLIDRGNAHSQYIATAGRGFHSWNIIDAPDCAAWVVKICR
jgi:pimeloyl-ACP methyl ester carboxylesterase